MKIDKDVPMPPPKLNFTDKLSRMKEPGDSLIVKLPDGDSLERVRGAIIRQARVLGFKVITRREGPRNVRIWRRDK